MGTLWTALAVPVATLMICFCLWLNEGCSLFWPFISDLGIYSSMIPVFSGGLSCTAILIAVVLLDIAVVRVSEIAPVVARQHAERSWCFCLVQAFTLLMGFVLVVGIVEVGFLPWNVSLDRHLKWALALFGASFGIMIGNSVSLWMLPTVSHEEHHYEPWPLRLQVSLLVLSILIYMLVKKYTAKIAFKNWEHYLHAAKVDFHAYCLEKSFDAMSAAAVLEWLYMMCLLGSLATVCQEFKNVRQDIWCSAESKPLLSRQRLLKGKSDGP